MMASLLLKCPTPLAEGHGGVSASSTLTPSGLTHRLLIADSAPKIFSANPNGRPQSLHRIAASKLTLNFLAV